VEARVRLDERLLQKLLDLLRGAAVEGKHGPQAVLVASDELGKGLPLAAPDAPDQLLVDAEVLAPVRLHAVLLYSMRESPQVTQ
jgi:hypothetical protein